MKQRNPRLHTRRQPTEERISSHIISKMEGPIGDEHTYEQRGVQPTPASTTPIREFARFGATMQGRR